MSAPLGEWSQRLSETGPIDSRRVFDDLSTPDFAIRTAASEVAAGRLPILSFKVPNDDWAGVAAGVYDAQLRSVTSRLAAIGGEVFVTLHHEPQGDGTPANYSAMLTHAFPIIGAPDNIEVGPIVNGYWFTGMRAGLTDAQLAQWMPSSVLRVSDVVAADCYQGGTAADPGEGADVKISNMSDWASRVGVTRLGLGEYNGLNAATLTAAGKAVMDDPRFAWALVFNSNVNNRVGVEWLLTGDRLEAFKGTVAESRLRRG